MSRRGQPPKPTRAKAIAGTLRADRVNHDEPMPRRARPRCPSWLPSVAKAKWKELVPELDRLGLLTIIDGDALATYCLGWHELREATEMLATEGHTLTNKITGATKPHPAVAMQRSAMQAIRQFAALFGLDPSSRGRLKVPTVPSAADPMDALLDDETA